MWPTGASWVGGTAPGTLSGGTITINSATVVVDGTVQSKDDITANLSNISINAGDTLVILGNLTLTSTLLSNNGVLIVFGNVSNNLSNSVISGSGKLVVTGNYSNSLGANTFTGPSYVYGSTSGFLFPPAVGNQGTLQTNDPALYNYTNSTYVALPVTLLSFRGDEVDDNIMLKWSTASEINNDYFTIERSVDGMHFAQLAAIGGAGNSTTKKNYEYVDEHPCIGRSYYRLTQVDYDGKRATFKVIAVLKKESELIVPYPNPTSDELYVDIEPGKYTVSLYDRNGYVIPSSFVTTETESGRLALDFRALDQGMYVIHLVNKASGVKRIFKVVKR